tara:strand:+ start:97 stop:432 length:336 start_codon:yes stop_codon:yes gene_type:complete
MSFETFKWLYQRLSAPFILILSFWLVSQAYQIKDYSYESLYSFFSNYINLIFFILFILFSLFHTSVEVFHSINDYFLNTKNEKIIKFIVKTLYGLIFLSLLIFVFKIVFII